MPPSTFFSGSDDDWSNAAFKPLSPEPDLTKDLSSNTPGSLDRLYGGSEFARAQHVASQKAGASDSSFCEQEAGPTGRPSSPTPSLECISPPRKRKRVSVSPAHVPTTSPSISPPPFESAFLGAIVVGNAWSTVKGAGYVKSGDYILIERDGPVHAPARSNSSKSKNMKSANGKGKQKQISIATMIKPRAPAPVKTVRKPDSVVRLTNMAGFEFGRLPQDIASWVSRLLDLGIILFQNSTVIDCPERLHHGCDIIVNLGVYVHASAFESGLLFSSMEGELGTMFNEGQETTDELMLRERKSSLQKLFAELGLRPRKPALVTDRANFVLEVEPASRPIEKTVKKVSSGLSMTGLVHGTVDAEDKEARDEGSSDEEELSDNQLDIIYKKAQSRDQSLPEMEPADTFSLVLRGYQKQALKWMHSLETGTTDARAGTNMHPLWEEYIFPSEPVDGVIDLTAEERSFYFNPFSGEMSLEFPKAARNVRGGILADEMGMGKSIMVSALIQTLREPDPTDDVDRVKSKRTQLRLNATFRPTKSVSHLSAGGKTTLIVAPTSLLQQWADELTRSSRKGTLKILVWHGQNRLDLQATLEGETAVDVVITSFGTVASEHAKTGNAETGKITSPVFTVKWLRVVLDEAHHCKSRISKTARAVYSLQTQRRWALTGTPIVNRLEDLYSLLKFLDYTPWSNYSFFRSFITLPFLARDTKAIQIVQVIMESVLLRREKNMVDRDGRKIVDLPVKEISTEVLQFSAFERKIYDSLYKDAKQMFEQLSARGLVGKNFTHILAMLMRLRRAVLHPSLVISDMKGLQGNGLVQPEELTSRVTSGVDGTEQFTADVIKDLGNQVEEYECPLCLDVANRLVFFPQCMHRFCKICSITFLQKCEENGELGRCPTCLRGPVKETELLEVVSSRHEQLSGDHTDPLCAARASIVLRRNDFKTSTKLEALMTDLRRLHDQDPCFKAVIFSQFTSFLDLIEVVLKREHLQCYRFDGSMDLKRRNLTVTEFNAPSRRPKILVISLKAGGVGLNLTTANHVFMMDCWWNSAAESQAIDRVHRLGQTKTVHVKQFIIADTVEERILQIQKRKTAIVNEAFRGSAGGDKESLENLKIMFDDD